MEEYSFIYYAFERKQWSIVLSVNNQRISSWNQNSIDFNVIFFLLIW